MPNIDNLSIEFTSKGTENAVKNIKAMGYAIRNLSQTLKTIDGSKVKVFAESMATLKKSVPTKNQSDRMVAFGEAVKNLSGAIGTANIGSFSKDMSTLGSAVEAFKKSSVNSITNAVSAMQNLQTQTKETANTINSVTPKSQKVSFNNNKPLNITNNTQEIIASLDKVQVKAQGVQGVMQKIGLYVPTKGFKTLENNAEKIRNKYEALRTAIQKSLNAGEMTSGSSEHTKKMAELDALRNKYDELILKQKELAIEGKGFTLNPNISKAFQGVSDSVKGVKQAFGGINSIVQSANKGISALISKIRSIGSTSKKASQDTTSLNKVVKKLGNELFRVSKMLKLMIVRKALRAVIAEIGNGFQSLAIHSDEFNNAMSSLINGSKTLGYSFSAMVSPLINALAPAIVYVINLLTRLLNVFNQVISALTGASSWNKAKAFTDSWRDSIEGAGSAASKTAKELKKTVLGFDELNQLQDNKDSSSGSGGIADMFETLPIESKWKDLANKIKALAQRLFDPIKKAWDKVGDFVKKSWKYAMDEVLEIGKSVARDFLKVWEQEATQKIFENIFEAVGWIGVAVGNLAKRFREAWDENNTGLHILEAIRDIILIISEHIKDMAKATAEWADNLDFRPLLTSIQGWLESLKPAVDAVMGILEDFYNQVVLKFTEWVIESGLPELINVFKRFNEEVKWDQLRERLSQLWEHLEPFMETIGEGLIIFIERVTTALADFINGDEFADFLERLERWMDSVTPEDVADAIEKLVKAIVALKVAQTVIPILSGLASVLGSLSAVASGAVLALKGLAIIGTIFGGLEVGKKVGELIGSFVELTDETTTFGQVLRTVFDPSAYEGYDGIIGSIKLIGDTFVAVKDLIDMTIEDIKKLWHAFWGDTEKAQSDGNSALERLGNTTTSVIVNPFRLAKYLLVGDPIVIDMWNDISKAFTDGKEAIGKIVTDLKDGIVRVFTDIKSSVDSKVAEIKTKLDEWKNKFAETKENIGTSLNTVKENAVSKFNEVKTSLSNFKDEWVSKWEENKNKLSDFKTEGGRLLSDIKKDFTDIFGDIRKSMDKNEWTFEGVGEGLKSTFEQAKNGIKGVWNSIAETLNGDHDIGGSNLHIRLPKFYATGGFPEDGLFFANHSELVGTFSNGKTAVANNAQIVEGIQRGVYSAVSSAMAQNNGSSRYISNEIVVDGEVIARTVTKAQDRQDRRFSPSMG